MESEEFFCGECGEEFGSVEAYQPGDIMECTQCGFLFKVRGVEPFDAAPLDLPDYDDSDYSRVRARHRVSEFD